MSTQDSLQAMLAASLQPKAGFLGMPDYVDPRQSQAIMSKIQQLNYAQQYPVMQQGAVQAGQGFGNFLQGVVGHFRGNAQANPDQGLLSNIGQSLGQQGQTAINQTFPSIAPQAGDGGGQASMPDPSQAGAPPQGAGPSPQGGAPAPQGAAPAPQGGSNLPGTQPMSPTDAAMMALYQHTLQDSGGDELKARVAAATLGVNLGRYGATEALSKAKSDLVERDLKVAQTYKETGQGTSAFDEPSKRLAETANNVRQRAQEDTRLGIDQQNANTNASRAARLQSMGGGEADPDVVASAVQKVRAGLMPMPSGAFLKTPLGQAIYGGVVQAPDYDATNYADKNKTVAQYTPGGTEGKSLSAFNVALNHGDELMRNVQGLQNGDVQALNKVKNVLGSNFGATGPGAVALAAHLYSAEVQKTVINNGGTADERDQVQDAFKNINTPAQFQKAVDTANNLLVGKLQVSRQNWETHVMQGQASPTAFEDKFMSPTAKRVASSNPAYQEQFPAQPAAAATPQTNAAGWTLHKDASGNTAYVSPDGKQFQSVGGK